MGELITAAKCLELAGKYVAAVAAEESGGVWTHVEQVAEQIPGTLLGYEDPERVAAKVNAGEEEACRELVRQAMKDAYATLAVVRP